MKTLFAQLLALVAAVTLAAPAHAKEKTTATIWGASASVTIDDQAQIELLPSAGPHASVTDPPKLAPFYSIDVRLGLYLPTQHVLMLWVPSARRVAGVGVMGDLEWFPVGAKRARMLDEALGDLEPYKPGPAWPPGLKSTEQIAALASATAPSEGFRWTSVLAWVGAAGVFAAAALVLVRRRTSGRLSSPRPA